MKKIFPFIFLVLTLSCQIPGPQGPQGEPGHSPRITMETTDLSDTSGYEIRFFADGLPISEWLPVDHGERGATGPSGPRGNPGPPGQDCMNYDTLEVRWNKNPEPDIKNYVLYYKNYLMDSWFTIVTADTFVYIPLDYQFKARAVDQAGNQSEMSGVLRIWR